MELQGIPIPFIIIFYASYLVFDWTSSFSIKDGEIITPSDLLQFI